MNPQLSPAVAGKLEDFRVRRQQLILSRGLCASLISVVVALIVIALLDWMLFLPEAVRWLLSLSAYASVAAVLWFTCLRLIWRIPNASQMARLIETAEPSLREELVSAVELGEPGSDRPWQSTAFRRFLQENVAHKMTDVNVRSLLPWALIHRWVNIAVCAGILFLILLCIPGLHFGTRVTRALLPMADISRVSLTQIEILTPDPPNAAVAQGDEIEVLVRIGGPANEDAVTLETSTEGGESIRVPMSVVDGAQRTFKSNVRMGRQSMHYRVWANDARTDQHLLLSRQRPQATSFQKTYRYPDYLQRPERTETEKSGDLAAVEGTEVDLVVEVSQPVSLAHLIIDSQTGSQTLPMTTEMNEQGKLLNRVRTTVPMTSTGSYRIRLVAAETGLENKFSPEFMIQAEPDKPPTIRIDQPPLAILVPSDEIVSLEAAAEDDWVLDKIEQHVRVGEGDWTEATIAQSADVVSNLEVQHPWDLYPLDLEPGSVVFTKLVAVDRKGNRGESQTIRAVISSHEFDARRWNGLADARAAHDTLAELVLAAEQLREATLAANDPQTSLAAVAAANVYDEKAGVALAAVTDAIRTAQGGRESIDLVLVGQAISQASTVGVGFVRKHLAGSNHADAVKASEFVLSKTSGAAESFDHLLRLSETSALTSDLLTLGRMYSEAMDRVDAGPAERVRRRMQAIGSEAGVMAEFVAAMRGQADETENAVLQQVETDLLQLDKLGDPFAGPLDVNAVRQAGAPLRTSLANSMSLFREGLLASVAPRKQLIAAAGNTDGPTFRAARYARELHEMKESLGDQAARGELERLQEEAEETKQKRDLSAAAFDAAVSSLITLAALEQKRRDSDARFVADSSRGWRAIEAIRVRTRSGGPDESRAIDDLDQLAHAIRVLNIVHQTDDLVGVVTSIFARDSRPRQDSADAEDAVDAMFNPSDWFCAESQYESLSTRLKEAGLSPEAIQILDDSRRSEGYRLVRSEMVARPQLKRKIETKSDQVGALLADLKRVRALLQDDLEKARETFEILSPRIEHLLAELAHDVREDAEAIDDVLENAAADAEQVEEAVQEQLEEADELAERMEEIRDALREDAAEQNLMQDEGRQRMRDDDDALAMLEDQPQPIDDALQDATQTQDPQQQRDALAEAARQQAELAEQLEQLAEHFENLHEGDAAESRAQLRDAEEELGVREQFDQQQRQLEQLAELAELPAEEALDALEEELQQNRLMQSELDELTRQQLQQTQAQLETAADRQQQIADAVAQRAEQLQQWSQQIAQLGREATQLAADEVAEADEAIEQQQQQGAADQPEADPADPNEPDSGEPDSGEADPNGAAEDEAAAGGAAEAAERAAEAIEQAQQQLARAAERSEVDPDQPESMDAMDRAADDVAEAIRQAADQLSQASEQVNQASEPDGPSDDAAPNPSNSPAPSPAQQAAAEAADQAEQLAQRAEQLANEIGQSADGPEEDNAGDVWEDPNQQQVADSLEEAQQSLAQAARNQQRLGNENNAEQLQQIAEATEQAGQLIEQNAQQSESQDAPLDREALAEIGEQMEAVEEAINEPAGQLEEFLSGEAAQEPGASEPGASEPGASEPGASEPGASEPGASEPGASEPGASEPGASEPGASEPGASEPGASEPGASEPGASEPGASEPGASEPGASEPGASEPGASEPGASEPGASEPGASEPGASEPGASEPGASEPGASEPGASEPGASEPGASEPGASEPGASEPGASEPGASEPGASEPGASEPGASEPGASEPGASEPGASEPGASEPGASEPGASEPGVSGVGEPTPLSRSVARQLAEALNTLDEQRFGESPGASPPGSSPSGSSQPNAEPGDPAGSSPASAQPAGEAAQANPSDSAAAPSGSPSDPAGGESPPSGQTPSGPASDPGQPSPSADPSGSPAPAGNSPSSDGPASSPIADAIAAAAQAQGRELAEGRSSSRSESSSPVGQGFADISRGAALDGGPTAQIGVLPPIAKMTKEDWARLPPKVARDLLDGRREKVSPEYRQAVETYFRLIAEKSLEK